MQINPKFHVSFCTRPDLGPIVSRQNLQISCRNICNEFWSTQSCMLAGFNSRFLIFPLVLCKVWIDKNHLWPSDLTSYQHQQDHNKGQFLPSIPWCLSKHSKKCVQMCVRRCLNVHSRVSSLLSVSLSLSFSTFCFTRPCQLSIEEYPAMFCCVMESDFHKSVHGAGWSDSGRI